MNGALVSLPFPALLPWSVAWLVVLAPPLLLAPLVLIPRVRPAALRLAPWAPLGALAAALLAPLGEVARLPLLLTTHVGLTPLTQAFLLFTAPLWLLAGLYGRRYLADDPAAAPFWGAFLLTLTGNLGVLIARDVVTFYLFFTLMSFAAYPLVVHERTPRARRAARIYLSLVIVGEAFLLPATILIASAGGVMLGAVPDVVAEAPRRDLIIALALAGFGVKAGALPLHLWLPLAHPAAPTPASAVLSGTMIKTGLLGWAVFLPLGTALPGWGRLVMVMGVAAALYGALVGVTQKHPKTVLAYSSISQMGLMTVALGLALYAPVATEAARTALVVYAAHHAFAKVGLFLGVGVAPKARGRAQKLVVGAGLVLAALALTGAPLTSGAVAKGYLTAATGALSPDEPLPLEPLLQLAAIGTTLLMARFLVTVWPRGAGPAAPIPLGLLLPWLVTLLAVAFGVLALPEGPAYLIYSAGALSALSPALIGALLALLVWLLYRYGFLDARPGIPEGDLVAPLAALSGGLQRAWARLVPFWRHLTTPEAGARPKGSLGARLTALENLLGWTAAGGLFLFLVTTLLALQVR
ncbi:NADH/Ubiquinone/plastoquinone (complex I) [Truepera radiovictrix DSM 17093]|uniref:NADH/Ubiquinone/plastoquinone (Complex I) n=1 Tax=Truepera radiovictrix (strain DSM 17093 / CIP 108686 / LMG 22925 / RQ-24) TaxID=649638 RepID=D7CQ20_TRURR|nr:NADH/Ubiquinone/plastoquinone (complex I) [Truepera radiovictrix DSM 17093]